MAFFFVQTILLFHPFGHRRYLACNIFSFFVCLNSLKCKQLNTLINLNSYMNNGLFCDSLFDHNLNTNQLQILFHTIYFLRKIYMPVFRFNIFWIVYISMNIQSRRIYTMPFFTNNSLIIWHCSLWHW